MQRSIEMADGTTRTIVFDKIGTTQPDHGHMLDQYANGGTGMEYEMFATDDGPDPTTDLTRPVYIAACHEDVGLVTWYRFNNSEDAYLETQYDPTGDDDTDDDVAEWARWK